MTESEAPSTDDHINFDAPAVLRKWPSLNNQRRTEGTVPYLLLEGTLDECIREFMASRHAIGTCMRSIHRLNRRWLLTSCRERSLPNSPGFGSFSDVASPTSHRGKGEAVRKRDGTMAGGTDQRSL